MSGIPGQHRLSSPCAAHWGRPERTEPGEKPQEVLELYDAGIPIMEIARRLGLSHSTVGGVVDRWRRRQSWRPRGKRHGNVELALSRGVQSLGQCPQRCWLPHVKIALAYGWRDDTPASQHRCPYCSRTLRRVSRYCWDGQVEEVA